MLLIKSRKKTLFVAIVCSLLFFLIKYLGPSFITNLFNHQQYSWLNLLARSGENKSLDFYQGQIEDFVFGPLKSLVSGLTFILLSTCFLHTAHPSKFALSVLIFLLITKFEILFNPPYGETIIGHFSDAIWLKRHAFNYAGYFQLEGLNKGGPQHYPTSIFPSLLAFLMTISPTPKIFLLINHLLVFISASILIAFYRETLKQVFNSEFAMLLAIFLLSLPIFQSMSEVLNLEIPYVLFAVLSIHFLVKRRLGLASITAILSVFIKAPGGIICATVFLAGLLLSLQTLDKKKRISFSFWAVVALVSAILNAIIRSKFVGEQPSHNKIGLLLGWQNIIKMPALWIFILILIILGVLLIKEAKIKGSNPFNRHFNAYIFYMASLFWFLLYLNFSVMGPRYKLLLAPFYIVAVVYPFWIYRPDKKMFERLLFVSIIITLLGSHGLFYGKQEESSTYSYNWLERSLEYRNDLEVHKKLAKELEDNYSQWTIGAPYVVAQMLVMPEIGYVKKALDVVIYGNKASVEGLKDFNGLSDLNIRRTIWVGFEKNPITDQIAFPIGEYDKLIKELMIGNKKAILFMGGFAIERMRRIIIYLDQKYRQETITK